MAASKALGLDILTEFDLQLFGSKDVYEQYKIFRQKVDYFSVQVQISHIRSPQDNSIHLDANERTHLRAYVDHIKDIIEKSNLSISKKERLLDKINAFVKELDRDRTPLQKFHDIILMLAATGADAVEELEPTWKWVKLAAAILGVKQETEQAKIPAPQKRIEGPKRQFPSKKGGSDEEGLDDEIPF